MYISIVFCMLFLFCLCFSGFVFLLVVVLLLECWVFSNFFSVCVFVFSLLFSYLVLVCCC